MFQTDESGLLTGQTQYPAKGYGDVVVTPPAVPAGHVARWTSTVARGAIEYGEPGTGEWVILEDHRQDTLYTSDGPYTIGSDHQGQAYDGLGPVPAWLTTEAPPAPEPEPAPIVYPQFTALETLDLFTEAEQLAVAEATMTVPAIKLWYDRLIAATFVTYEDPRTEGGIQALVDAGLLTAPRKAAIVAAMQPQETAT